MSISIIVDKGDLQHALDALARFADFRKRFLHDLPRHVIGWVRQSIRTRLIDDDYGPDNEPWPGWAPGYEGENKLLFGSGKLANSLRAVFTSGRGQLYTNVVYAAIHHYGGVTGRNHATKIPARPWFGIGKKDTPAIEHLIQAWLDKNGPA